MPVKNKKRKSRSIILAGITLLLVAVLSFVIAKSNQNNQASNTSQDQGINYAPPTQTDKSETDQHKQDLANQKTNSQTSTSKEVSVVITSLQQNTTTQAVEARSYANTFNNSGTCTLILAKGSSVVSTSGQAIQNVSTMSCGKLEIARSKLSAGLWAVTLTYNSGNISGKTTTHIEVK